MIANFMSKKQVKEAISRPINKKARKKKNPKRSLNHFIRKTNSNQILTHSSKTQTSFNSTINNSWWILVILIRIISRLWICNKDNLIERIKISEANKKRTNLGTITSNKMEYQLKVVCLIKIRKCGKIIKQMTTSLMV